MFRFIIACLFSNVENFDDIMKSEFNLILGEYFKILFYYFISSVFLYQIITQNSLHCTVIFSINIFSHIGSLCVYIIFISHPVQRKIDYYMTQIIFHYSCVCVFLSRRDVYKIKNVPFFRNNGRYLS